MKRTHMIGTGDHAVGRDAGSVTPALLSIADVAKLLQCSRRQVYRLNKAERLPRPVKLGSLVRWDRQVLEDWISLGCPPRRGQGNVGK